jgi:hypothetical protein
MIVISVFLFTTNVRLAFITLVLIVPILTAMSVWFHRRSEDGYDRVRDGIANVMADLRAQVSPDTPEAASLLKRYPKAVVRKFNPATSDLTEGDAVIAYLQMLGTLVDFNLYDNKANLR